MSLPRPIFEGDLYLVTRRTRGRQFLLKPSKKLNNKVEYCIAVAAARHGIQVHAVIALSNHWHAVASDPRGRMPEFLRDVHSWIAKNINMGLGRWENVWSSSQTSLVRAEGASNVLNRIVYTMTNPVAAGLVAHGKSWPGLRACWPQKRKPTTRPPLFRVDGPMPETATLELHCPPGFDGMTHDTLHTLIGNAIAQREQFHRDILQRQGRRFVGRSLVLAQSVYDRPETREPRRQMSPRVAERDKWRRIEALHRLRSCLDRYRSALAQLRAGFRDVLFPKGTYKLRVNAAVRVALE